MSMFRKPGEDTSSSSETSYEQTENEETSASHQDSVLSRIQTLESAASAPSSVRQRPSQLEIRQNSTQNVRDLMLHALLEEKAIRQAAQQLGKDISDPEVQRIGREAYQELARQISSNVDDTYATEDMRNHRATAQEGITKLTRSNLSRLAMVPEGSVSQALVARPVNGPVVELLQQPSADFEVLSGLSMPSQLQLRGYPGLQTDRYVREFSELEIVGKGGYGKVYKAKHKLDGSLYAVKRIPVSPAKIARVQEHGPEELESLLREVRSLARFDHTNVIRYHNAWLEYTTTPIVDKAPATVALLRNDRLLENAVAPVLSPTNTEDLQAQLDEMSFGDVFENGDGSYSAGIVFENSGTDADAEVSVGRVDIASIKSQPQESSRRKTRLRSQASQATIATVSSIKSRMSAVEDVDEEEDDIEIVPRSHVPHAQELPPETSEDMISHSDIPGQMISVDSPGPILMLNVQMSLCETSLAAFLSAESSSSTSTSPVERHCFHPCVSLEMLNHIVSGVEYLHAQGVVHRDLKPANVFLSLSTAKYPPYGSVDLATCKSCSNRKCLHVIPRIGDFGLVAALDDRCMGIDSATKPVGTEFYRPDTSSRVSEKLDVYALGVIAFEMLQTFGTRMERIAALTDLRRGQFPEGFAHGIGDLGEHVQQLISDMTDVDEQRRLGCEDVKEEIAKLVHVLREN
jgi:translation initiation factor 2-alpha kinase 3